MKIADLNFEYPEELVGKTPQYPPRVLWAIGPEPREMNFRQLLAQLGRQDVLVVNDTQVLRRRVFAGDVEILFLKKLSATDWEVLFPSKKYLVGDQLALPLGLSMTLLKKGRPQVVQLSAEIDEEYFDQIGELPLPPYIQKARQERHNQAQDNSWYQTAWATKPGSFAAPTASLHFKQSDLDLLVEQGVEILKVTLHVGLGTFLPVTAEDLDQHEMHEEFAEISAESLKKLTAARKAQKRIWAVGTTSVRTIESYGCGLLTGHPDGSFSGMTQLLIQPGYQWKLVDFIFTNFHQPQSTLLALVAAFSSLNKVHSFYAWAIQKRFRLFSYGDLTVWQRET